MSKYRDGDDARLGGSLLFGDLPSFACGPLVRTPASIDTFLGRQPGTTLHGAQGGCYAVTGVFIGGTSAAVQQQIDAMTAMAGASVSFGFPTGDPFPGDFLWSPRWCYFDADEFLPGSIASGPGNQYSAPYRLVIRCCPAA
jgi:hypothetical protein